jgi:hypothetical protein
VGIGETDSHLRKTLHFWGGDLIRIGIPCEILVSAGITHPHIIGQQHNNIG